MTWWRNLRVRLALSSAGVATLAWAAFGTWLYYNLERELLRGVDDAVLAIAEQAAGLLADAEHGVGAGDLTEALGDAAARHRGALLQILDRRGGVLDESDDLERAPLRAPPSLLAAAAAGPAWRVDTWREHAVRLVVVPVGRPGSRAAFVQVAAPLDDVLRALRRARWMLALGTPGLLLLAGLGGWLLADRALRRMEEAAAQLRRFSADASHELRTPLTVLRGEAEVALRQPRAPAEYQETLETILAEARRMGKIVEDLLLLSQSDAGELKFERRPVDLSRLIAEVAGALRPAADSKGVRLDAGSGPCGEVAGDPVYLRQLLVNLVDNAVKYTPRGGRVEVACGETGDARWIAVTDTGMGIPGEALPHVFDRFYRVDKARSRGAGGSGLGLSIALWIARAHGGGLEAASQPGRGSRFTVTLPKVGKV